MHVLITTTPIPAHTWNATAFVQAALARGWDVSWHAPSTFHPGIAALGADPVEVRKAWHPGRDGQRMPPMGTVRQVVRGYTRQLVGRSSDRARDLLELVDERRPDVIVSDTLAYGAGEAAEAAGVHWVTFGDGPVHARDVTVPPFGSGLSYRTAAPFRWRNALVHLATDLLFAAAAEELDATRRRLGLASSRRDVLSASTSPMLHLHGGVPELEYPRRRTARALHFVGELYRRRPDEPVPELSMSPAGPPVVAVTQGSMRPDTGELLEPTVRGLADQDVRILAAVPSQQGASRLRSIPLSKARLHLAGYIPYDLLLSHADVFVTNGGWTGVTSALARGVPVLQVGRTEEKLDIGRRVQWSGAGRCVPRRRVGPAALRRAVCDLLSDRVVASAASRLSRRFSDYDAGEDGCDLVQQLMGGRLPAVG